MDVMPTRKRAAGAIEVIPPSASPTPKKVRDYAAERASALAKKNMQTIEAGARKAEGLLGEDIIMLAQALVLVSLPIARTSETRIAAEAQLSDTSTLRITFSAALEGIPLPFGNDRYLLDWLCDRAIRSGKPFVDLRSASQFLIETGRADSGKNIADVRERLTRIAGLTIGIERDGEITATRVNPVIKRANIPKLMGNFSFPAGQELLPGMEQHAHGLLFDEDFFSDMRRYRIAFPRKLWLLHQEGKGNPTQSVLAAFLQWRLHAAQSQTIIPWEGIIRQLGTRDSNMNRLKGHVRVAVERLKAVWPEAQVEIVRQGLRVDRSPIPMLPDDPSKNRVRRIGKGD
jgi:hypothetical protein